jgi:hypothetical protein
MTLGVSIGCKKIEPPIDELEANAPIYVLEGFVDGDSLKLEVNDTSVFINSGPFFMNGIDGYTSTISDVENDFELKLIVLESELYINENGVQVLNNENLDYIVHEPSCIGFDFYSNNGQTTPVKIQIENSNFSSSNITLKEYGIFDMDLIFPNINNKEYTLPVPFGFTPELLSPSFTFSELNNFIKLSAENESHKHEWYVDNVLMSTSSLFEQNMSNGLHLIRHVISDEFDNSASDFAFVYYENENFQWYLSKSTCDNYQSTSNYGNVIIEIISNGESYSSVLNLNNKSNNVNVSNLEYVFSSLTVLDYIKFNLSFDADLDHNSSSEKMLLRDFKGTFNVKIE